MMKLFIDPNYTPPVFRLIKSLHELQSPQGYEVVTGELLPSYTPANTIIFKIDQGKKGLEFRTVDQFRDGYHVIAYKSAFGSPFDPFECSLVLMSQWRRILEETKETSGKMLIALTNTKQPYRLIEKTAPILQNTVNN